MAIEQAKVFVEDLQRGMFVSRLDRPWTRTPFALQGFYIRDLEEIRQLQKYCRYVYVDVVKTVGDAGVTLRKLARAGSSQTASLSGKSGHTTGRAAASIPCRPVKVSHNSYPAPIPLHQEAGKARQLYQRILRSMDEVMVQLSSNRPLPVRQLVQVVEELVESVLRSPDAFAWLARVRDKDEHTYNHSLRASIWVVVFGRHVGLARHELAQLGLATLLKDIGKLRLSDEVLQAPKRNPRVELEYRKFVNHSVKLLAAEPDMDPQVISIVQGHREQHDGSGYPRGLRGDQIPVLARMCGIVTFYDECTNPRGKEFPVAPSKAVGQLYELRDIAFQEQLVVEFIQAIGLYPIGTQVELSTGEVAVVVEQTYRRRLKPKVVVVLDSDKKPLAESRLFDMAADDDHKQALIDRGKLNPSAKVTVVKDLEPSQFPQVDVAGVRDRYVFKSQGLAAVFANLLGR